MTRDELLEMKAYLHRIAEGKLTIDDLLSVILRRMEEIENYPSKKDNS